MLSLGRILRTKRRLPSTVPSIRSSLLRGGMPKPLRTERSSIAARRSP
jgi:hypothetical protein